MSNSKIELSVKNRVIITSVVTLLVWVVLLWDHFHGGVPMHHIMDREDMPALSNWWGGVLVPLLTWVVLYRIVNRNGGIVTIGKGVFYRFVLGLLFGLGISYFFTLGSDAPDYMLLGLFILAPFVPLYLGEYLLGFVLGTMYTLGGVLPVMFGLILITIYAVLYKVPRFVFNYVRSKTS